MNKLSFILLGVIAVLLGIGGFMTGALHNSAEKTTKLLNDSYIKGQSDLTNAVIDNFKKEQKLIIPVDGTQVTLVPEVNLKP